MTHVTCRLTAKNRDQLRNPSLGNRVWASFAFLKEPRDALSRAPRSPVSEAEARASWRVNAVWDAVDTSPGLGGQNVFVEMPFL